jgi:adenine-specific DNA-methyltransferase
MESSTTRVGRKRPIEQYDYSGDSRKNNPPVGLVTSQNDRDTGKKRYAYDPHIDPALQFDSQAAEVEAIIDVGLAAESLAEAKDALQELKQRREPYLNWAGKAERTSFEVPTVSLHVHERIDPKTVIDAVRRFNGQPLHQLGMFESPQYELPFRQAIDFYQHDQSWTNRLIAGDSLLVMNSLLEKEGMAGKVQMIYIDPPYGIRYGSNFQPFVDRRNGEPRISPKSLRRYELSGIPGSWEFTPS